MYNIQIATSAAFNSNPASRPPQTGWIFDPVSPIEVITFIGQANPADITIETTIKDYILALGTGTYSDFYVKLLKVDPVLNGSRVSLFSVSGPIAGATGDGYHLSQVNLEVDTVLDFELTNIPVGYFRTDLLFQVFGKVEEFYFVQIDLIRFIVNTRRLDVGGIYLQPSGMIQFDYVIGGSIPA